MRERLIRTEDADYVPGQWTGENLSSIRPIGDMVLVLPDTAANKMGRKGLIFITDDKVEKMTLASETGVIVAMGADAFQWNSDRSRPFADVKPKTGDHVVFARYSGRVQRGKDGRMYRLMSDNVIGAILEDDYLATEDAIPEDYGYDEPGESIAAGTSLLTED